MEVGMPRSKRWPFNSGLSVPLLLHIPERFLSLAPPEYEVGAESKRLDIFRGSCPDSFELGRVQLSLEICRGKLCGESNRAASQIYFWISWQNG